MNLRKTIPAQNRNTDMHNGEKAVLMNMPFQYICIEGNKISRLGPIVSYRGTMLKAH